MIVIAKAMKMGVKCVSGISEHSRCGITGQLLQPYTGVIALALAGGVAVSACNGTQQQPVHQDASRDEAVGVVHVDNPVDGVWTERTTWRLVEDLRIGKLDGEGPEVFGRVAALDVDSAGRIYVFDGYSGDLRVFGPDGRFLWSFGRRGTGPGEFEGVIGMSVAPNGSIWLVDAMLNRYTVIEPDTFRVFPRPAPLYRLPWLGGLVSDNTLIDSAMIPGESGSKEVLIIVDDRGTVMDSLPIASPSISIPSAGMMTFSFPYAPKILRTFDRRGYVWLAVTHEYRLTQLTFEGDTTMVVERDHRPRPLNDAQKDTVRRYASELRSRFGVSVRASMLPETGPILKWFVVDDRGYLWVCRATSELCSHLDVFDADGRFLGEVSLPFSILGKAVVRHGNFYAVAEGELGEPVIVRARIVGRTVRSNG